MCKFSGKILMLTVMSLILSASVAMADASSVDWNNSWSFPSPAEKANLLNQALAIELIENGGFNVNNRNFFGGDTLAIGSQVIVDVNGNNNMVNGISASTNGNTAAQINDGSGSIGQNSQDSNNLSSQPTN